MPNNKKYPTEGWLVPGLGPLSTKELKEYLKENPPFSLKYRSNKC